LRKYYYNNQWRVIEELDNTGTADREYVYNPADRWNLIRRKYTVSTPLDTSHYVLRDFLNPVAIVNTSGVVQERYGYDAFGPVRFMDASFATLTNSAHGWNWLFHGEFLDASNGLYNYGYRYYDPVTGRWPSRDPIGERGGINLYGMVGNDPVGSVDVRGLHIFGSVLGDFDCKKPCKELCRGRDRSCWVSCNQYKQNNCDDYGRDSNGRFRHAGMYEEVVDGEIRMLPPPPESIYPSESVGGFGLMAGVEGVVENYLANMIAKLFVQVGQVFYDAKCKELSCNCSNGKLSPRDKCCYEAATVAGIVGTGLVALNYTRCLRSLSFLGPWANLPCMIINGYGAVKMASAISDELTVCKCPKEKE
jgi:RHS repeat-associated protein